MKIKLQTMLKHNWRTLLLLCTLITTSQGVYADYLSAYNLEGDSQWKNYDLNSSAYVDVNVTSTGIKYFFIVLGNAWYGLNSSTMSRSSCSNWKLYTNNENCGVDIDVTGTYRFQKGWNETCTVTISYPDAIKGSFDSWALHSLSSDYTYTSLTANTDYEFGVMVGNTFYKGGTKITSSDRSRTLDTSESSSNAQIKTSIGGSYTFSWNNSSKTISVTYPCTAPNNQTVKANNTATSLTVCTGTSVTITTSGSQNYYTYGLFEGDSSSPIETKSGTGSGLTFTAITPTNSTSSSVSKTYKVKGWAASNCSKTQVGSVTVNVDPNAALTSVGLSKSSVCTSDSPTATANGKVLGGGTGAWSSTNTGVATVAADGAISPASAGTTDITYTITGGCGTSGPLSKSATLTVNPNASVSSATVTFEPSGETCTGNGTRAVITGAVLGGGTGAWSWQSGTGKGSINATTGVMSDVTTGTTGTQTIRYTITGGCGGNPTTDGYVTLGYSPIISPAYKTVKAYEPVSFTSTNANITEWAISPAESSTNYLYDTSKRSAKFKGAPGTYVIKATNATITCKGVATVVVEEDDDCE